MAVETLLENGAEPSGPGWLGLEEITKVVNWQLCRELGNGVARVVVAAGSPAEKAGLKTGDYVITINGSTFAAFNASPPQPQTIALLKVYHEGKGHLLLEAVLAEQPTEQSKRPSRFKPIIPCGASVGRNERLKWLSRVTGVLTLRPLDKAIAGRLISYYLSREGWAYPAHGTLARELNVSVSSIQRSITNMNRHGVLHVSSRKKCGRSNKYRPCWPDPAGTVLQLSVRDKR